MTDKERKNEFWPFRAHLLVRPEHMPTLGWIWVLCFLGMGFYFATKYFLDDGLIDIDDQAPRTFQYSVDVNTAPWPEFANLPGIGEVLARSIVRFREENGDFRTLEQLMDVPKIGQAKFEMIEPFLVLRGSDLDIAPDESAIPE